MSTRCEESAFPRLNEEELRRLRHLATQQEFSDGETVFKVGDADIDLFVVESGKIDILNPTDNNRLITTHEPGTFAGDIDLLTRRPVIVTAVARGPTRVLRVSGNKLRELLIRVPSLSEKLIVAFTLRREMLSQSGVLGLVVIGPGQCKLTNILREFLYKNFVPFTWFDPETPEGKKALAAIGPSRDGPIVACGNGQVLIRPSLRELAQAAGVWRCHPDETIELAVVGAGPAGISAAVYAASEGISTVVIDRMGPGGQASGSSKIENFIGFPAGLSGAELATRGVLQMLKFGARMIAPANVERLEPAHDSNEPHTLYLDCGTSIHARTVLVASGIRWRRLEAEGAGRFENAGIYYVCTSVEALLYDQCDVAVVGGGNSAGQAAMFLAECCPSRRVHMLIRHELGPSMSEYLTERIRSTENIVVHERAEIAAVRGKDRIESLEIRNTQTDERETLGCMAVFVFIGANPSAEWLPETVARDRLGYLLTGTEVALSGRWPIVEREPCPLETTLPGVLAAGDIRSGSTKRVGFAVGDGSLAVTCVHRLRTIGALSPAT
jgi:thioredoxin reductase (NADPH)